MSFYIQHGYGKGQKIATVADAGDLEGVILSPGDEDPGAFGDTAAFSRGRGLKTLVDPQTYYYSTQPQGRGRNHEAHRLELSELNWAQDARSVAAHIDRVGELNQAVNANGLWIAPGPLQDTFADVWTPLAVQFARTASQSWGPERTLVTLAVSESGLSDWQAISRWLDVVTTLPVRGFYLLVSRPSTTYPSAPWPPQKLGNLLRLVHALAVLNEFEVVWGYSDFEGLLALSVGGTGIASGWSYTLRQFSSTKWTDPATGGRPATVRTHLSKLWSLPRAEAETAQLLNSTMREQIFTEAELNVLGAKPLSSISRVDAQVSHLLCLAEKAAWLSHEDDLSARVRAVQTSLDESVELWNAIGHSGLLLEPQYQNRVTALRDALRSFQDHVAL